MLTVGAAFAAGEGPTDNYATTSGGPVTEWGVWQQVAGVWHWYSPTGENQNHIDVTGQVEIWEQETLSDTKANFHWGRTDNGGGTSKTIAAYITGTQSANCTCTIDVWAPDGCNIGQLDYVAGSGAFGDAGGGDATPIPVTWEYGSTDAGPWTPCTPEGISKVVAFPSGIGVGPNMPWALKISATPSDTQKNGQYKLDPIISVTPVL